MTQRERILAIAVGVLVLVIGFVYVANRVSNAFDTRHDELMSLESTVSKQKRTILFGLEAQKDMDQLLARSLPSNRALARSHYQAWLLDQAVEVGFTSVKVSPMTGRERADLYFEHAFLVSGFGDLAELTDFMYRFYSVDTLHRIGRLNAKPLQDSKDLDLNITVEAVSLNSAPDAKETVGLPAHRLAQPNLESYLETIVYRNPFAPANNAPQLTLPGSVTGNPNRTVSFRATGRDEDEGDQLSYDFAEPPPEGAEIDAQSGEFRWLPSENGEYEVVVRVTDNGLPRRSSVERTKIAIVDAPAEPVVESSFDPATQAVITGITQIGGAKEVWVTVRTEGRVLKLREGDTVSVGSISGTVQRISRTEAEIKTEDGRNIIVGLGKSLVLEDEV